MAYYCIRTIVFSNFNDHGNHEKLFSSPSMSDVFVSEAYVIFDNRKK